MKRSDIKHGNRRQCGECPCYGSPGRLQAWCSVKAVWTAARLPACDYGISVMKRAHAAAYLRKWRIRKRGKKSGRKQ